MRSGFIAARLGSFRYAANGLATIVRTQHNAWIHIAAAMAVCAAGFAVGLDAADWKWLVAAITLVWFAEAMNTGFEYLCDVVSPGYSESVKHAKDIAAGAVLICAIGATVIGALIFVPYL